MADLIPPTTFSGLRSAEKIILPLIWNMIISRYNSWLLWMITFYITVFIVIENLVKSRWFVISYCTVKQTCFKIILLQPWYFTSRVLLDTSVINNYRPISNLPILSEFTKKAVFQVNSYSIINGWFDVFQSGCRPHLSTETALVKWHYSNTDSGNISVLVLLECCFWHGRPQHTTRQTG